MAEGFKPSEAELRAWLVKTCEERYPYRNGETYHSQAMLISDMAEERVETHDT